MIARLRAAALAAIALGAASCADSPKVSEAACPRGWAVCGASCVDLSRDVEHCGACGNACAATQACSAGTCATSCAASLHAPVVDPWGFAWDGVERQAKSFQAARDACAAIGARLPTVSETYRVSGATAAGRTATGAVGDAYRTNWLWSLVPHDPTNAFVARLNDGAVATVLMSASYNSRCVCPPERPAAFTGRSCFGPPGSECAPVFGGKWNIDREDRPPLSLPGAMFECAAAGGELPSSERLVAAISDGVPNGTNAWLHTGDVVSVFNGEGWDTIDGAVQFTGTTVNGMSWTWWSNAGAFRCVGPAAAWDAPAVATTFTASRGGRAVDLDPETASSYAPAVARCWAKGGQLPTATELAALVMQGLPARSYGGLRLTSDQVRSSDDSARVESLAWDGEVHWEVDPARASATANRDAVSVALSDTGLRDKLKTDALPFQCTYAAVDPSVTRPADSTCANDQPCLEVPSGDGRVRFWIDAVDRGFATFVQAAADCASRGGRLPSGRDYQLAIRAGLLGYGVNLLTSDRVWTADVRGIAWTSGTFDAASWVDASTNALRVAWNAATFKYRCMWTNEVR